MWQVEEGNPQKEAEQLKLPWLSGLSQPVPQVKRETTHSSYCLRQRTSLPLPPRSAEPAKCSSKSYLGWALWFLAPPSVPGAQE